MSRSKRVGGAALSIFVTLSVFGCGGDNAKTAPGSRTMKGVLTAPECGGGYDLENSQVILRNEAEEIIGTGQTQVNLLKGLDTLCAVSFEVDEVPDADFYTVEVGTHSGPAWSKAELEALDFSPSLNLGSASIPASVDEATMCTAITGLGDDLNDETVIDSERLWTAALRESEVTALGFAVTRYLGDDPLTGDLTAAFIATFHDVEWDSWYSIPELNKAVDAMSNAVDDLLGELDCSTGWDEPGYVAGGD